MWQGGLGQKETSEHVGAKDAFGLAGRDGGQPLAGVLDRGIVDEDVEPAERLDGPTDGGPAEYLPPHIPRDPDSSPPMGFNESHGFPSVTVLVQVDDRDVGPLLRKRDRHGPADSAVPS